MIKEIFVISLVLATGCSHRKQNLLESGEFGAQNTDNKIEIQVIEKQHFFELIEEKTLIKRVVNQSSVIVKLIADADESTKQGDFNIAASTLERALRIAPREAKIFNKLAYVRFKQKKWDLAENLAKKAALLAEGDKALKKKNWLLIFSIRQHKGDHKGASYALLKAKQYKL
jgi:tetratricopeptide (TPR) repeat protein